MFRMNFVLFCLIWLLCLIGVAMATYPALSAENYYNAIEPRQCHPSIEQWIQREADGGRKIVREFGGTVVGVLAAFAIRWDDGTVQEVTVGPAQDPETGEYGVCILARRHVSPETN